MSKSAFPELPTVTAARVPKGAVKGNQSLKNILGNSSGPSTPVWEKPNGQSSFVSEDEPAAEGSNGGNSGSNGKGKKGKGKQKQTLFTLGSFPT